MNKDMRTPLHEAAIDGDLQLALTRIRSEEDIDQTDQDGDTPLFLAVTNKNVEIVEALLQAGANPEIENRHGNTALWPATFFSQSPRMLAATISNFDLSQFFD